jgi:hypothetical protein
VPRLAASRGVSRAAARAEESFVRASRFFGGGASIVSFLLLPRDFPLRRFLFIEPQSLDRAFPLKIRNGEVRHDQSKGFAVRRGWIEHDRVFRISPARN